MGLRRVAGGWELVLPGPFWEAVAWWAGPEVSPSPLGVVTGACWSPGHSTAEMALPSLPTQQV